MDDTETIESRRPERFGRYTILGELGRGGMGVVYRAHDPRLDREIAIKVLLAETAPDPKRLRRFQREAKVLAALSHPNIATIHDLEDTGAQPFIAQELIEGDTLAERIKVKPLPLQETLTVCRQIAVALEAAHKKDVVHRDLKPANVKITPDGIVKVLDFGIAMMVSNEELQSTVHGRIVGTPGYMSPEQLRGESVDARTDLWALGCILFECLTGERAFRGKSHFEIMLATQRREPMWKALPEETPDSLRAIVEQCLAKDRETRYESAEDIGSDLDDVQHELRWNERPRAVRRGRENVKEGAAVPQSFVPDTLLGERYRVTRFLGRGGMGRVYEAHDELLSIPVALKTLHLGAASAAAVASAVRRLKREVLLSRTISHPNVCRTYDVGQHIDGGQPVWFLTMELLRGETLHDRIQRRGMLTLSEALPMVEQMTAALGAAHRAGIVHRDFKSGNVMVVGSNGDTRTVVTDFGLARTLQPRPHLPSDTASLTKGTTAAGQPRIDGTAAYMAPEQVWGRDVTPASDIYALGVVLYQMVAGTLPFQGETPWEIALRRVTEAPRSPRGHVPDLDLQWERTILRCLAREPKERFQAAEDVAATLAGRSELGEVSTVSSRSRYNTPVEPDAFVGRTEELDALHQRLTGTDRLVTVLGLGGIGKTRLALRYGRQHMDAWPGGVWFCDLSEARSIEGIAFGLATALDVPLERDDPIVRLGHAIAGRGKSLLILDNFEQVVEHAEATLGRWLARATEARFLITTRERLGLPGEMTCDLGPLDFTTEGLELFEVRAEEHRPGFRVDEANRRQVVEIVQKLDGLPLAIELATARLRMLSLDQLRDRLEDRFRILAGGRRGRHATLTTALDWSWEMLELWEQSAIAQASVFQGGFTIEAAEAVIDLSAHDEAPFVLDVIQSLMDKSWLRAKVALDAPRFDMYATVQEYASAKLRGWQTSPAAPTASTSPVAVEARHGEHYAPLGHEDTIRLQKSKGRRARETLRLEVENLVIACRRAAKRQDAVTGVATLAACWEVLKLAGSVNASVELGQVVLRMPNLEDNDRARALGVQAHALRLCGRPDEALQHGAEALAIHRKAGNSIEQGTMSCELGSILISQGRTHEAADQLQQALRINRDAGNRAGDSTVHISLGGLQAMLGRFDEARRHFETSLVIVRELGDRTGEGILLSNLGSLLNEQGQLDDALRSYEDALVVFRELGDRFHEGTVIGNLGALLSEQGRLDEATCHLEEALMIHRELGNRRFEGNVVLNLGGLWQDQGNLEEARRCYEEALAIFLEVDDLRSRGIATGSLGKLLGEEGLVEDALNHLHEALTIHRETGDRRFEGIVLGALGGVLRSAGQLEEAQRHLEEALAIHQSVGNKREEGVVLGELAALHLSQDRIPESESTLDEGIIVLRETEHRFELGKLLCSRAECERRRGDMVSSRQTLIEVEKIATTLDAKPASDLTRSIEILQRPGTRLIHPDRAYR